MLETIIEDENQSSENNGHADRKHRAAESGSAQGRRNDRLTRWVSFGRLIQLEQVAAFAALCVGFAVKVHDSSAMNTILAFVGEHYRALTHPASATRDFHAAVPIRLMAERISV